MATNAEIQAMRLAITLSALGLGTTSPNPPVGCVILDRDGNQVGAGFHHRKGQSHAEANALSVAGPRAAGGTAVVTLEPCNHIGVTPACRQLLLEAGISKVVIAVIDPTSRGDGGASVLRAAGVDVEVGVLPDEAMVVLRPWLTATTRQRPWVTWHRVVTPTHIAEPFDPPGDLRRQFDVAIRPDGSLVEGLTGGHSKSHFKYPARTAGDPLASLQKLFDGGVRSVLILGDTSISDAFRSVQSIDYVSIDFQDGAFDVVNSNGFQHQMMLDFVVGSVARNQNFVRVAGPLI